MKEWERCLVGAGSWRGPHLLGVASVAGRAVGRGWPWMPCLRQLQAWPVPHSQQAWRAGCSTMADAVLSPL